MRALYLVIDDIAAEAERTVAQLQAADRSCDVLVATTVDGGLALLEERRTVPSLIFLEADIPDGAATEFLANLRSGRCGWLQNAPVAMLSRHGSDRTVVSCYRLGACAFLTKPVRAFDLRDTLRQFGRQAVVMSAGTVLPGGTPGSRVTAA